MLYGRIIKIPSTYDPENRTYANGIWKGDWKLGWTNNPAWIFYDLITNKLAGLGLRIGDYGIDKFQLYEIAKYCDELVDDGYGGKEPRMVSNLWITEQREAYNVLSDMASVFSGDRYLGWHAILPQSKTDRLTPLLVLSIKRKRR